MAPDTAPPVDTSLAAHAFSELRGEVSLLRRAVERTSQPDYAPSLEAISIRLEHVVTWAQKVSERPGIKLSPKDLEREIAEAAASRHDSDRQALELARSAMKATSDRIDAIVARSRSASEQDEELRYNRIAFAVAGMVLWAILPGALARSLPVSWAAPERIAARMLGTNMWDAGQNMMAKADPQRWNRIVAHERERAGRIKR